MKILVLYNFYIHNKDNLPKLIEKLLSAYSKVRLNSLVNSLNKNNDEISKIKVIDYQEEKSALNENIDYQKFSDLRLSFNRVKYIKIKKEVVSNTRKILKNLFKNLENLKTYNLNGIFIPRLLEYKYAYYFNVFFGHIELILNHIKETKYEKIIFYNCNPFSIKFLKLNTFSNAKLFRYNDKFTLLIQNISNWLNLAKNVALLLGSNIKNKIKKKKNYFELKKSNESRNILFLVHTKNQFKSLNPVYKFLKNKQNVNPIYYFVEYFIRFFDLSKLIKFLLQKRRIVKNNQDFISNNLKYRGVNLIYYLKYLYKTYFFSDLIEIFNFLNNLKHFLRDNLPNLLIVANDFYVPERTILNYFHDKKIKILFIPHAAIPILDEFSIKSNIDFFALGGEADSAYYVEKGIPSQNIVITGIPRYEKFYKNKINKLRQIKDMFDERIYDLNKNKFSILLTTNPIDDKSNEKIIESVVKSLKDLNIIDNLIIKLHPSETGLLHSKIIKKLNVNPIIVRDYDILELINSCDILISQKSTTLLEAMIIGTPMILIDFVNKEFTETSTYGFLNEDFIISVKNQTELSQKLNHVLFDLDLKEEYIKILKDYAKRYSFYDKENKPIQKIAELILDLLN